MCVCVCAVFAATLVKHSSSYHRAQMKALPNLNGSLNHTRELAWTMMWVIGFALCPERDWLVYCSGARQAGRSLPSMHIV